jgi:hypothetical protein
MASPAMEDAPSYEFASRVDVSAARALVQFAASSAPAADEVFFDAEVVRPPHVARLVLAVADLSLKRYFMPSTMLGRILAQGSSKVATHARALLALPPGAATERGQRERLRWRVEPAERWMVDPAPRE